MPLKSYITFLIALFFTTFAFAQFDSIPFEGYQRSYLVHLPSEYTGTENLPLLIAMHGGFGSASNIQDQSQLSVKADAENFIVVYPEGVKGTLNIRTWNGGACCGFSSNNNINDVGFIDSLLNVLIDQYSIDPNRIYATGISNGGHMSYRLACELSDRVAAIAPVSCSMSFSNCLPNRPVPVIHFHSYQDENVPYLGGVGSGPSNYNNPSQEAVLNTWVNINNCDSKSDTLVDDVQYTFTKWSNCDCKSSIHHYITQDGGHSWPGGTAPPIGDPVSNFINANDLMWDFFKGYSLDCLINSNLESTAKMDFPFILFPNPFSEIITIKNIQALEDFNVVVYDSFGKIVLNVHSSEVINLGNSPSGIYYFVLQYGQKRYIQKIIKL